MAILKIFKNRIPNSNYIMKSGKQINFVNGVHRTAQEDEIKELTEEHKSGNPHIYVDENEKEVDSNAATPLQIMEQKVRAQILAEMAAATDKTNDRGNTVQGKLEGIANSTTVAEGTAGSDSTNAGAIDPATSAAAQGTVTAGEAIGAASIGRVALLAKLGK